MQVTGNNLAPPSDVGRAAAKTLTEGLRQEGGGKDFSNALQKVHSKGARQNSPDKRSSAQEKQVKKPYEGASRGKDNARKAKSIENSVLKFMDSLESELGISAERFSAALSSLPEEVRALSVEESASSLVEQLGVPDGEKQEVTARYRDLWGQSQDVGGSDKSTFDGAEMTKDTATAWAASLAGAQPVVSQSEAHSLSRGEASHLQVQELSPQSPSPQIPPSLSPREKLNASIDEMNRRFFSTRSDGSGITEISELEREGSWLAREKLPISDSVGPGGGISLNDIRSVAYRSFDSENDPSVALGFVEGASEGDSFLQDTSFPGRGGVSDLSLQGRMQRPWDVEELPFLLASEESTRDEWEPVSSELSDPSLEQEVLSSSSQEEMSAAGSRLQTPQTQAQIQVQNNHYRRSSEDESRSSEESEWDILRSSEQNAFFVQNKPTAPLEGGVLSDVAVAPTGMPSENFEKIAAATDALMVRGGGEVKVQLTPEGLGELQLKVRYQGGRLEVEMKTDNRDSQRLLESSLQELKENLNAHRLSVDSIKVDVGGDLSRQDQSFSFDQGQSEMGREQARQFMNLFRDGNWAQRQAFFSAPGFQTYRTQREEPLNPISQEVRPRSSLQDGVKGRGINLVA